MKTIKNVFRSRVSVLIIVLMSAAFIPSSISVFQHKSYPEFFVICGVLFFVIFLLGGMRYIISGNKLFLKIWFIPYGSVDISDILSALRSYNPLSSPAASLKRLRISFKKRAKYPYMLISPVREREFIEALKAVNPDIRVDIPEKKGVWRIWDWDI